MNDREKKNIVICYELHCGGETVAVEEMMREFQKNKEYSIRVLCQDKFLRKPGVFFLPEVCFRFVVWIWKLLCMGYLPKIITTHYYAGIAALILRPLYRNRIVYWYHGSRLLDAPTPGRSMFYGLKYRLNYSFVLFCHRLLVQNADAVIIPNKETIPAILEISKYISKRKIFVIPNGVDVQRYSHIAKKHRSSIRQGKKFIWLCPCRVSSQKNIDRLFRAMIYLKKRGSMLILSSPSPHTSEETDYLTHLLKIRSNLDLTESIKIETSQYRDMPKRYNSIDGVILPSLLEVFPLVMLEAFASGKPFLGSGNQFIQKTLLALDKRLVLSRHDAQYMATKMKTIERLSSVDRQKIIRHAQQYVKQYDWKLIVSEFTNVLDVLH